MQNFTGSILTNTKFDPITPVLHELGWLTIEELLPLHDVTMIKCLNGLVPSYLISTNFVKRSETHSYCTRQNNILINNLATSVSNLSRTVCLPFQGA